MSSYSYDSTAEQREAVTRDDFRRSSGGWRVCRILSPCFFPHLPLIPFLPALFPPESHPVLSILTPLHRLYFGSPRSPFSAPISSDFLSGVVRSNRIQSSLVSSTESNPFLCCSSSLSRLPLLQSRFCFSAVPLSLSRFRSSIPVSQNLIRWICSCPSRFVRFKPSLSCRGTACSRCWELP